MILANLTLSEEKKFEDTKLGKKFKVRDNFDPQDSIPINLINFQNEI